MQIIELLNKLQYNTIESSFYQNIQMWESWYKGKVDSFHSYSVYNGEKYVPQEKYSLGMAKTSCEDWANYIFNKDTIIGVANENANIFLDDWLKRVNFDTNMNENIETAFAMGTCAVTILDDGNKGFELEYIKSPLMIFPLTWSNGEIINCCFGSYKFMRGKIYLFLNIHELEKGKWIISNRFFEIDKNGNVGSEFIFDESEVTPIIISDVKRYFIYKPAIINNTSYNNPMGISIFANAIDALKGVDNVYDSYINEFVLGKKRIMVSADACRMTMDGKSVPPFNPNDTTFYYMDGGGSNEPLIKPIDMPLRVEDHNKALQDMLNMLSVKIGMGTKHYNFVSGTVTATEIKSTRDTLYNSMIKHESPLEDMLVGLCKSVLYLYGFGDQDINIEFSDSVIADRDAELVSNLQLLTHNVIGRADVLAWWSGMDLDVAKSKIKELDSESSRNMIDQYPVV